MVSQPAGSPTRCRPDPRRAPLPGSPAGGLVDERRHLGVGDLGRVGILHLDGSGSGAHDLHEVRSPPDLLANRAPDVVRRRPPPGTCPGRSAPRARSPRRSEPQVSSRGPTNAPYRIAWRPPAGVSVGADVADRGHAHPHRPAQVVRDEVAGHRRVQRLGTMERLREAIDVLDHRHVGVGVDETRHQGASGPVDDNGVVGRPVVGGADRFDRPARIDAPSPVPVTGAVVPSKTRRRPRRTPSPFGSGRRGTTGAES
jgi:hypothetical protein